MIKDHRTKKILEILAKTYQGTTTALNFHSPFELLVAVILSAQTNDNQVNKITAHLFQIANTPEQFARFSQSELEELIKTCGLYKNKAKNLIAAAKIIIEKYHGEVPNTREELMQLPGVGRKTANVVLSNAFNVSAIAVDTHVFRVAGKLGLSTGKNPEQTELQLMDKIPQKLWADAHHWFIWHGRKICTARSPKCSICPLNEHCPSHSTSL